MFDFLDSAMRKMEGMADPIADLGMEGVNDPEKVAKWLDEKRIDPNDPKYADLFYNYKVGMFLTLLSE